MLMKFVVGLLPFQMVWKRARRETSVINTLLVIGSVDYKRVGLAQKRAKTNFRKPRVQRIDPADWYLSQTESARQLAKMISDGERPDSDDLDVDQVQIGKLCVVTNSDIFEWMDETDDTDMEVLRANLARLVAFKLIRAQEISNPWQDRARIAGIVMHEATWNDPRGLKLRTALTNRTDDEGFEPINFFIVAADGSGDLLSFRGIPIPQ